jgi:hypothetical protein
MKDLIRHYVIMAEEYSKDATKQLSQSRIFPDRDRHFYQYLHYRGVRKAYMHAARLAKKEMCKLNYS